MLHLDDHESEYTAYVDGLTQFVQTAILGSIDLKQNKNIKKIKITINNISTPTLSVPYQMIESSKKVEKISPGHIHIT
jgi:hypothetical protein